MTELESALRQICDDLNDVQASFALIGGLAVSARTEPRFTRDADFAVAVPSDDQAEAIVRALCARGYAIGTVIEQRAAGRLSTVRLTRSRQPTEPVVDLLFASSGIEPEIVADAEVIELLPGLRVRVAMVGHLIALKILARNDTTRPQDVADLRALLRVASDDELTRARDSLTLITDRGYHRQRDLHAEFAKLGQ